MLCLSLLVCYLPLAAIHLLWQLLAGCHLAKHLVLQIIYFLQSIICANFLSALSPFHHTHIPFKVANPSFLQMVLALGWTSSKWPVPRGQLCASGLLIKPALPVGLLQSLGFPGKECSPVLQPSLMRTSLTFSLVY